MKPKLVLCAIFCVLCSICVGQWSEPALVWQDTTGMDEARLLCTPGDTFWTAVMDEGWNGQTGWHRIQTAWSTGDSWPSMIDVTGLDSGEGMYSGMGFGCDPQERLWLGWYRGNAYEFQEDSWAVCTAMRDNAGWHPFVKSIDSFWSGGAESFAADRQGNWYMSVVHCALDVPGIIESAMYSRLDGDAWTQPAQIAAGMGSPISSGHYSMVLVPHPDTGLWEVNDWPANRMERRVYVHRVYRDTSFEMLTMVGDGSEASADSAGRLWVVYARDSVLRSATIAGSTVVDSESIASDLPLNWWEHRGVSLCTDPAGWVWVTWMNRDMLSFVSYNWGSGWSHPEQVCDSLARPYGILSDSRGRVYVLASMRRQGKWGLYTTYRLDRPGIDRNPKTRAAGSKLAATVLRGLPRGSVAFDATGRRVTNPKSGIYFVRAEQSAVAVRKVILQR